MEYKKKLIEVALPLEAINTQSAREKSIRHGHPSTLHLWWARRPLAAARAVIWASLVDDPSSLPEQFPTEEEQTKERKRLFAILSELVKWENSNNKDILDAAKAEIMKSTNSNPPALLDPFAGGGAIPLEAQRLGLEAHASDLNPVAVMINKAMIEIPPKFAGQPPVNPDSQHLDGMMWSGAQGLAEDVRYYGEWMKQKTFECIGHLYPKVKDEHGHEHIVIAWIWARTVKCPNPACGCDMPLAKSFDISKKKDNEAFVLPVVKGNEISFVIETGKKAPKGTVERSGAHCICCNTPVGFDYIRSEGQAHRIGAQLMAVVAEGTSGRIYFSPDKKQQDLATIQKPISYPSGLLSGKARVNVGLYGFDETGDLFTNRQLVTLATLSEITGEAMAQVVSDGGSQDYAQAIGVYLAFVANKLADNNSSIVSWNINRNGLRNTFSRQAIPMSWDYAEANPFSNSAGCLDNSIDWVVRCLETLGQGKKGFVRQFDAQSDNGLRDIIVSTDPPYYDNIAYADLSDFFYVWLRQSLKQAFPDIFKTMLVPKSEELVATPYRFEGNTEKARSFFEDGMLKAFSQINTYARVDVPVTVYYAFKQSDDDDNSNTASTGWETMLSAIIRAGFAITGTWPMRTERASRTVGKDSNALASSIILVCRKRPVDALICTRRDFINTLKRELKPALAKLQASNIAPVDLAQSAIGPGMGVYSRYSKVLEADGTPMSVRSALQIINQELDLYFTEQDGELDRDSRFCVDLYTQYAFNDMKFGEADVLARAKNTSVEKLAGHGVLYAQKGVVRLLTREEISDKINKASEITWLFTQQLTKAMETGGIQATAKIIADIFGSGSEKAKSLAYRLFTLAERKGWAAEAYAYNSLVIAWPEIQSAVAEIQADKMESVQMNLFDVGEGN